MLNLAGWPVLSPGAFEAHELFHLFVLTGAGLHYGFILTVVAPHRAAIGGLVPHRPDGPHVAHPRPAVARQRSRITTSSS